MPKLKNVKIKRTRPEPVWKGPSVDGITQSMLSRFLCCRERFRIRVIEGLKPEDDFNVRLEYGNMWHVCEESLAGTTGRGMVAPHRLEWEGPLKGYAQELCARYPLQQEQIQHWYRVCLVQFPLYIDYWRQHPDVDSRQSIIQEEEFCVPYTLVDGRMVKLRGKWDSVDLVTRGKNRGIWLQENKTKADVGTNIAMYLTFDLQTMFYLTALSRYNYENGPLSPECDKPGMGQIRGVRYNVVRRPLSGGKGSIRQKKGQTSEEFYAELGGIMKSATGAEWGVADTDHFFFMRWNVHADDRDVAKFRREFLDPVLIQLCDWYDWITSDVGADETMRYNSPVHWRYPYGVYNPTLEGRATDVENYLLSGSTVGLRRDPDLFPELKIKDPGASDAKS